MKMEDDKKKGVSRLGHLIDRLVISDKSITFSRQEVSIDELKNVLIYADDFEGKLNEFIGISYGVDNSIEFEFKGNKYSFQFQVKSKADLKLIDDIAQIIEPKTHVEKSSKKWRGLDA
jgi:hypothetical protein